MGDTASMWGEMLGLGPILKTVADPAFHAQLAGFLQAMQATYQTSQELLIRVDRLEHKLDRLLILAGETDADLRRIGDRPAVLTGNGAAGPGGHPPPGAAADPGAGAAALPRRIAGG